MSWTAGVVNSSSWLSSSLRGGDVAGWRVPLSLLSRNGAVRTAGVVDSSSVIHRPSSVVVIAASQLVWCRGDVAGWLVLFVVTMLPKTNKKSQLEDEHNLKQKKKTYH
jgi:hypothetical protein